MNTKDHVDLGNAIFREGINATEEQIHNIIKRVKSASYLCVTKEKQMEFEEATKPLIKFLADNFNPHVTVIVDCSSAELVEGVCRVVKEDCIEKCNNWKDCPDKYNGCAGNMTSHKCAKFITA